MLQLGQVIVDKVQTTKDGGLKITLLTQDITTEQKIVLFDSINAFETLQIKEINAPETKSQSQRLRAVLYRLWEQGTKATPSEDFIHKMFEELISYYKEKLN
jgi:hypothetical protein